MTDWTTCHSAHVTYSSRDGHPLGFPPCNDNLKRDFILLFPGHSQLLTFVDKVVEEKITLANVMKTKVGWLGGDVLQLGFSEIQEGIGWVYSFHNSHTLWPKGYLALLLFPLFYHLGLGFQSLHKTFSFLCCQSHWNLRYSHHHCWKQAGPPERPGHPPLECLQPGEEDMEVWLHWVLSQIQLAYPLALQWTSEECGLRTM